MSLKVGELFGSLNLDDGPFNRTLAGAGRGLGTMTKLAGAAAIAGGAALVAGAGVAAFAIGKIGMGYQDSLNIFKAVSGANAGQMKMVADRAKELGNDLTLPGISAAGAATAMTELAKAGLSVEQSMAAAKGVLQLAKAATVDEGTAAQMTAMALNAFSLGGDQAVRVADLLAAAANSSMGEITDMGFAMSQSAAIFASAGISVEDLTASIAMLANKGILGSDAGTSLKTMLMSLQSPTGQAKAALDGLGVSVFNADGSMRGYRDIIASMSGALAPLTDQQRAQAVETIFGSDAARAANIIFGQSVEAFDLSRDAVTKQGAAAEVAAAKAAGLSGAIDNVISTLETMAITIYDKVSPAAEGLVRSFGVSLGEAGAWATAMAEKIGKVFQYHGEGQSWSDAIGDVFSPGMITEIAAKGQQIVDKISEIWNNPAVQAAIDIIKTQFKAGVDQLSDAFAKLGPTMTTLQPVFSLIASVLGGVLVAAVFLLSNAFRTLATIFNIAATIVEAMAPIWSGVASAIMAAVSWIIGAVQSMAGWVQNAAGQVQGAMSAISAAFWSIVGAVGGAIGTAVGIVSGLPGRIAGAIGDLSGLLYNAGRNIVQGLINGIGDMIGALGDKASEMASAVRDHLPFSPAKLGPLSGSGNPYLSGLSIVNMLASGLSKTGPVVRAAGNLAGAVQLGGIGSPSFAGAGGGSFSGSSSSPVSVVVNIPESMSYWKNKIGVEVNGIAQSAVVASKSKVGA